VDKSVVTLADDKTLRTMPAHFLLTTEVRRPEDLEYADFLLGSHPQAAEALDLLLGTQGWRRFAEQNPNKFRNEQKEEAERLLVMIGQTEQRTTDLTQREQERIETEYVRQTEQLTEQAAQAKKMEQEARGNRDYLAALVKLKAYDDFFERLRFAAVPAAEALLALAAIVCLILGLYRRLVRALPYYAATAACVAMVLLLARGSLWNAPPQHSGEKQVAHLTDRENDRPPPGKEKFDARLEMRQPPNFAPMAARAMPGMGNGVGVPQAKGGFVAQPQLVLKKTEVGGAAAAKQADARIARRQIEHADKRFKPWADRAEKPMAAEGHGLGADMDIVMQKRMIRTPAPFPPMPV
ncbi:MAG: hypothetical protein ACRELF_28500, partial [Gemmataceae bacterium]